MNISSTGPEPRRPAPPWEYPEMPVAPEQPSWPIPPDAPDPEG